MSDVLDKAKTETVAKPKNIEPAQDQQRPKVALLVEMIIILLLAGVVFIFIFGLRQVRTEEQRELAAKAQFEQLIPKFGEVAAAAEKMRAEDEFGDWPLDIEFLGLPANFDPKGFEFAFSDGIVTATTTRDFGKQNVKIIYNIDKKEYSIEDPDPDTAPKIKYEWLPM